MNVDGQASATIDGMAAALKCIIDAGALKDNATVEAGVEALIDAALTLVGPQVLAAELVKRGVDRFPIFAGDRLILARPMSLQAPIYAATGSALVFVVPVDGGAA